MRARQPTDEIRSRGPQAAIGGCQARDFHATTAGMPNSPRACPLVIAAIASLHVLGCADPCVDDDCVDPSAVDVRAQRAPTADAPTAPVNTGITFSVEGTAGAKLVVDGAKCTGDRCAMASIPSAPVRVDLTLSSRGNTDMPVWVRWRGCAVADGQLWPVWSAGPTPEYETLYTHIFEGLTASSQCVAEVAQGSWYIFAGDRSVRATSNPQYCREQFSSPENLNLHCFIPAKEKIALTSDLRSWACFGSKGSTMHRQANLDFTAAGNEVVSCMGSAR